MAGTWKSRVGVLALTATMGIGLVGIASPAGAAGNNDNAKACQQGGFVNYSRTDGTRFKNAGECTSYAAKGGTLVALPDLVPDGSCTPTATTVSCTFRVRNIGAGDASGTLLIQLDITRPINGGSISATASAGPCIGPTATTSSISPNGFSAKASCPDTLTPGQTSLLAVVSVGGSNVDVVVTATVDPNNTIVESNETNNTFSQTFDLTP
jgi:hypothetical protein